MKKILILTGILVLALGAFTTASACDEAKKIQQASSSCNKSATATTAEAKLASADAACATKVSATGCATKASTTACATKVASDCGGCPVTAGKAAYASTMKSTGCEKTAKAASAKAMGETVYANTVAEKNCSATAAHATYAYVKEQTGCETSAAAAYQHAVAKAAYDNTLETTGCAKTADAAYEKAAMAASTDVKKMQDKSEDS